MSPDVEHISWLRLIRSESVGAAGFHRMLARFGSAKAALDALTVRSRSIMAQSDAEEELARAKAAGFALLTLRDPAFPRLLAAIDPAPPVIYAKGRIELLNGDCVAIVGARNASGAGMRLAAQFAGDLGAAGCVVVSGLARGIDGAAHKAALPTGTIAVMAGGGDVIYPVEHRALYDRIASEGVVISELPPGEIPTNRHFPRRNRLVAGLSRAILLIEAAAHSGSLITARFGLDQGREIYAVPGSPLDPRSEGGNGLIKSGANLATCAGDLLGDPELAWLPAPPRASSPPETKNGTADEARMRITALLSPTPTPIDELIRLSGETPSTVLAILLDLELDGRLTRLPGQCVSAL